MMQFEPFRLEPGDRVRCVDDRATFLVKRGCDYRVSYALGDEVFVEGSSFPFRRDRFRPVVRVKMGAVYSGKAFDMLVARAVETFGRMSPEQQAAHREEQRESWVRAELELSRLERRQSSRKSPFEP